MTKIERLRAKAAKLYLEANDFDFGCGCTLSEFIRLDIHRARMKFNKVYAELQSLDTTAPPNPMEGR